MDDKDNSPMLFANQTNCFPAGDPLDRHGTVTKGIQQLPLEVLYKVFGNFDSLCELIKVGRVCCMFREASTLPSRLWSTLRYRKNFKNNSEIIALCMERSRSRNLSVEIFSFCETTGVFLDLISSTCSRWTNLVVDLEADFGSYHFGHNLKGLETLCSRIGSLSLPQLRSLDIRPQTLVRNVLNMYGGSNVGLDVYQRMLLSRAPALPELHLAHILPHSMSWPSLKTASLLLSETMPSGRDAAPFPFIHPLINFLVASPMLESFALSTNDVIYSNHRDDCAKLSNEICLPRIGTFTFSYFNSKLSVLDEEWHLISKLLSIMQMPNLKHLRVDTFVSTDMPTSPTSLRDMHIHPHQQFLHRFLLSTIPLYPKLQTFHLSAHISPPSFPDGEVIWPLPIGTIGTAEEFRLRTNLNPRFTSESSQGSFALRRVVFRNCENMDNEGVASLVAALQVVGTTDSLESLDIVNCRILQADKPNVRSLVSPGVVVKFKARQ